MKVKELNDKIKDDPEFRRMLAKSLAEVMLNDPECRKKLGLDK